VQKNDRFLEPALDDAFTLQTRIPAVNILVWKNNIRETRSDMSKVNRFHIMRVPTDVRGLFLNNVGSFSDNVGLRVIVFSNNVGSSANAIKLTQVATYK
jgi:hypothetical protein